jgi:hypothetical protein
MTSAYLFGSDRAGGFLSLKLSPRLANSRVLYFWSFTRGGLDRVSTFTAGICLCNADIPRQDSSKQETHVVLICLVEGDINDKYLGTAKAELKSFDGHDGVI